MIKRVQEEYGPISVLKRLLWQGFRNWLSTAHSNKRMRRATNSGDNKRMGRATNNGDKGEGRSQTRAESNASGNCSLGTHIFLGTPQRTHPHVEYPKRSSIWILATQMIKQPVMEIESSNHPREDCSLSWLSKENICLFFSFLSTRTHGVLGHQSLAQAGERNIAQFSGRASPGILLETIILKSFHRQTVSETLRLRLIDLCF